MAVSTKRFTLTSAAYQDISEGYAHCTFRLLQLGQKSNTVRIALADGLPDVNTDDYDEFRPPLERSEETSVQWNDLNSADRVFARAGTLPVELPVHRQGGSGGGDASTWEPEDFGAAGDGVANDTTALQAAVNAAYDVGGGFVYLTGTYLISALSMKTGVYLRGRARRAKIKAIADDTTSFILFSAQEDCGISDVTIDIDGLVSADGLGGVAVGINSPAAGGASNDITIENCRFIGSLIRPYINVTTQVEGSGFYIIGNHFLGPDALITRDPPAPQTTSAIRFLSQASLTEIVVRGNTFRRMGNSLQIRKGVGDQEFDFYTNVDFSDNLITDIIDDPNVGNSSLEMMSCTNATQSNNKIYGGGRGLNLTRCKNAVVSGNTIAEQKIYAIEITKNDGIKFVDNALLNCRTCLADTTAADDPGSINVSITDNLISGGNASYAPVPTLLGNNPFTMVNTSAVVTVAHTAHGLPNLWTLTVNGAAAAHGITINGQYQITVVNANSYTITHSNPATSSGAGGGAAVIVDSINSSNTVNVINMQDTNDTGYFNWEIKRNTFVDCLYTGTDAQGPTSAGAHISIGSDLTSNIAVEDNWFIQDEELVGIRAISHLNGSNISIRRNRIHRSADVSDTTYHSTSAYAFIRVTPGTNVDNVVVEENEIIWTGADTRAGSPVGIIGIGHTSSGAVTGGRVGRNVLRGTFYRPLYLDWTSGDTVLEDNDVIKALGTNTINAAITFKRFTPIILGRSGAQVTHTGNTTETTLATINVPANSMGPYGALRVTWQVSNNNSGGTKTLKAYLGADTFHTYSATTNTSARLQTFMMNRNVATSQVGSSPGTTSGGWLQTTVAANTATEDTTTALTVTLTGQLSAGADDLALEWYMVELLPGWY